MNQNKKSLLEQIYDGEFRPRETILPRDAEYMRLLAQNRDAAEGLVARLGPEDSERLDILLDLRNQLASLDGYAAFACGLRTGAQLICELLLHDALPLRSGNETGGPSQ